MKVAMTSDLHFDINGIDMPEMEEKQVQYLLENKIDLYLIAGDLFNDFEKSLKHVERMQNALGQACQVRFIAGNHDMLKNVSYEELESDLSPLYLHNKSEVFNNQLVVVGNNGWYDYSFAQDETLNASDYAQFKRAYWVDAKIQQPMDDLERTEIAQQQIKQMLTSNQGKLPILMMSHFVPQIEYTQYAFRREDRHHLLSKFQAMLGSQKTGETISTVQNIDILFGHIHQKYEPRMIEGNRYFCRPVGYGTKRHHEWTLGKGDFYSEWVASLAIEKYE